MAMAPCVPGHTAPMHLTYEWLYQVVGSAARLGRTEHCRERHRLDAVLRALQRLALHRNGGEPYGGTACTARRG